MKMKTNELTGAALDWAVAKCEAPVGGYKAWVQADLDKGLLHGMRYSSDWLWGGPIIEREEIALRFEPKCDWLFVPPQATWLANYEGVGEWDGPTPLIAAMRCYVASRLGDEIELPEELK